MMEEQKSLLIDQSYEVSSANSSHSAASSSRSAVETSVEHRISSLPSLLNPSPNPNEEEVQKRLEIIYGGKHQKCPFGIADIVTDEYLIEIKTFDKWSIGIGQLIKYSAYFTGKRKILYLFGSSPPNTDWSRITAACDSAAITLLRDEVDYPNLLSDYKEAHETTAFSLSEIPVYDRSAVNMFTIEEYKNMQKSLLTTLAAAVKSVRVVESTKHGEDMTEVIKLYDRCNLALRELQEYIHNLNDDRNVAQAFLQEMIVIKPGATVIGTIFTETLKKWLKSHNINDIKRYREQVSILLKEYNVSYMRNSKFRYWSGIEIKTETQK